MSFPSIRLTGTNEESKQQSVEWPLFGQLEGLGESPRVDSDGFSKISLRTAPLTQVWSFLGIFKPCG